MYSQTFQSSAELVRQLHQALTELERGCAPAQVPPLIGRDWYELLTRKLLPQLADDSFLVSAVVGGTNIGKSSIFNHLAGFRASATSPLASGTKHPTCLVPVGFAQKHSLAEIFQGFTLMPWEDANAPLGETGVDWLFWKESDQIPPNLLVLDTPDVDSDARINWERADNIRRCADVLVAVITQQKYNDAAVKEFFRKAAAEDKVILLVFNQVLLPEDEPYWPLWVSTFCQETGIRPEAVFLAPQDRRAAEAIRLPFYEREWPMQTGNEPEASAPGAATGATDAKTLAVQSDRQWHPSGAHSDLDLNNYQPGEPKNLLSEITQFRFGEIKLRTLKGSLHALLDEHKGVPAYLGEIQHRASEFKRAAELLSANNLAEIDRWPAVPNECLIAECRQWWATQRTGWVAGVHGFYSDVTSVIMKPFRAGKEWMLGESKPPFVVYREQEWNAILEVIDKVFEKLTWLCDLGNHLLKPRLEAVLSGTSRAELLRLIEAKHKEVDFERDLKTLVQKELTSFQTENKQYYDFFRNLDTFAAAARPVMSVALAVTGAGVVGNYVLTSVAASTMTHVTADVVGGAVAGSVGESFVSESVSHWAGFLETRFRRLHESFTAQRATWVAQLLQDHLLGHLPEDLRLAASIDQVPSFENVAKLLGVLREQ